jgi:ADP-heptose:LPS heptosyltransferase
VLLSLLSGTPETFPQALKLAQEMVDNELSTMSTESSLQGQLQRILQMAGDLPRSLLVSERFAAEDPDDPDRKFHLATAWISMGQERWAAGWRAVTEILTISRHYNHHHGVPIWEGQALGKRKLLVYQDQGVGDAILGFRFLPLLVRRGIRFELWVQPPLADLAACITGCDKVHRSTRVPDRRTHSCEFAITFFGLIAALYVGPDEIKDPPMVRPPADHAPELRERIRALPGKRIGLLYGGNPRRRDDWLRTVPVGSIAKLARLHGVSWVNLMVDERPDKAEAIAAFSMTDPMPQVSSFCDTAALVEELDAIVAVDASVAHVAGNLRKPLWVLAPPMRDWRWQIGEAPSPWWPTGRLVRCDSMGVWNQAVDRVFKEVGAFVAVPSGVGA